MNTINGITLPAIGSAFEGGFFSGCFFIGNEPRALIVSPRADGEFEDVLYHNKLTDITGATHYADGLTNTRAMAEAGSELAQRLLDLRIAGFDDWHLGSRLQKLLVFSELRYLPQFGEDEPDGFATEYYWTSTQPAESNEAAWCQGFLNGTQNDVHKFFRLRARAVRTIKL